VSAHKSDVVIEVRPVRKRRWSAAEKASIVGEGLAPGAVPTEIMRRHGISSSLFYTWRKQALAEAPTRFMPVRIAESSPAVMAEARPANRIEIMLPNGIAVRIDGAADARALGVVLKAVCR
jgi:transposase